MWTREKGKVLGIRVRGRNGVGRDGKGGEYEGRREEA